MKRLDMLVLISAFIFIALLLFSGCGGTDDPCDFMPEIVCDKLVTCGYFTAETEVDCLNEVEKFIQAAQATEAECVESNREVPLLTCDEVAGFAQ
jgi:hypothetical protein